MHWFLIVCSCALCGWHCWTHRENPPCAEPESKFWSWGVSAGLGCLTDPCGVSQIKQDSCSSAGAASTGVSELQRETWDGDSMGDKLLHWVKAVQLCKWRNDRFQMDWARRQCFFSVKILTAVPLEHSTQCRVQAMKGILKMGLLHFQEEIKRVEHCTCYVPQIKAIFFVSLPMSSQHTKICLITIKMFSDLFVLFSTIQKWFLWGEEKISYFSFAVAESWHGCPLSMPRNGSHSIFFTLSAMYYHKEADISFF